MSETDRRSGTPTVFSRAYLASLLERTARAGVALAGGLAYEASEVAVH